MADATFIGLGNMGLALATTAAKAGIRTVAWNRTPDKAAPLRELGAVVSADPKDAISASPVVVVCLYDYDAANEVLMQEDCTAALNGRALVQLTTASPRVAKATHDWAQQNNIAYLDGELIAYPSDIGGDTARILVAGDEKGLEAANSVLRALAPEIDYLGADPARASALSLAINSASLGRIIGSINGAAICEAANIPLEKFYKNLASDALQENDALVESLQKIEAGRLEEAEATVEVWAELPDYMAQFAQDTGYSPDVPEFMRKLFDEAIEKGLKDCDIGALINVLRPQKLS